MRDRTAINASRRIAFWGNTGAPDRAGGVRNPGRLRTNTRGPPRTAAVQCFVAALGRYRIIGSKRRGDGPMELIAENERLGLEMTLRLTVTLGFIGAWAAALLLLLLLGSIFGRLGEALWLTRLLALLSLPLVGLASAVCFLFPPMGCRPALSRDACCAHRDHGLRAYGRWTRGASIISAGINPGSSSFPRFLVSTAFRPIRARRDPRTLQSQAPARLSLRTSLRGEHKGRWQREGDSHAREFRRSLVYESDLHFRRLLNGRCYTEKY